MKYNSFGNLIVKAYVAHDALPISGVIVRVKGIDEENRLVERTAITDADGTIQPILLPAPDLSLSMSPNAKEAPYARYDVTLEREGYYKKKINNVAIFSGINTILPVNMIPLSNGDEAPLGNLNATSEENPRLE